MLIEFEGIGQLLRVLFESKGGRVLGVVIEFWKCCSTSKDTNRVLKVLIEFHLNIQGTG